jgi:sortase A
MHSKKNNRGLVFIIMGLLAIDAALFLTFYNFYEDYHSGKVADVVLAQMESDDGVKEPVETDIDSDMAVEQIGDYDYIGKLTISSLGLELPVISEWSYKALKTAPCRYVGSPYTDGFIIAAHNYSTHFGRLRELSVGDLVYFTDLEGNTFAYKVAQMEILDTHDVEEMVSGDWPLTLFTCTIGGASRVTIRCDRAND